MSLEGEHLGNYRLLRLLGRGGMGEVYLAEDARIGQQVAIKVIHTEGAAYPDQKRASEAARLFEREARAIALLDHPNILPLYAYGEETLHNESLNYLVMPYRKDGTLADWLRQRGSKVSLSPAEVAPLLQQAADALQYAHDHQVIHQDVKPTNFLVRLRSDQSNRPDLLLADFGIAKLSGATSGVSQSIRGTPTYMAPELWDGHPLPATDQYALAIMVYELLVGRPPFRGGPGQVMRQNYMEPPPAPSRLNRHLSPAIDAALLRALSKKPEERFPSVAAFAAAFQEATRSSAELHATLPITRAEAQSGTTRRLTLPGGRQVSISVPSQINDGTIMRLEGQGMPYYPGGPAGPLVLTITIQTTENLPSPSQDRVELTTSMSAPTLQAPSGELTTSASMPTLQAPPIVDTQAPPALSPVSLPISSTSLPISSASLPITELPAVKAPAQPSRRSRSRRFVLIGLAGLLIVATLAGGITWLVYSHLTKTVTPRVTKTATPHPTTTVAPPVAGIITEFRLPTPATEPEGIITGPDGNLWFTGYNNNQIERITPTGLVTGFAIPTAYSQPEEITVGSDGNLWFTEVNGNKIGRITPGGAPTEFTLPSFQSVPEGIAAGSDGNLWFTEYDGNSIGRITPGGVINEFTLLSSPSNPKAITPGPDGNLWFTEWTNNKIGRIALNGAINEFSIPTYASQPYGIIAGHDGNLWFTESSGNKIGRITRNGRITEFRIPTPASQPEGITVGSDGNLWFTEYNGNKIGRITPDGIITEFPLPKPQSNPQGITLGPDGNLWFTEWNGNRIGRITSGD